MKVRFWGTRGSIATPGPRTARYGGNTSCIQLTTDSGASLVLDCGTGARELALDLKATYPAGHRLHILIGHTHWDHIQGFPFFLPTLLADYDISIYAPAGFERSLEEAIAGQMQYSYFPVRLPELPGKIQFTELEEGAFTIEDITVRTQYLNHTAPTLGYRITADGSTVVYSADHEPFWDPSTLSLSHPGDRRHAAFFTDADLVIHDAQYTTEEYRSKVSWGHSPMDYAIAVTRQAGARRLALFHHDPLHDDDFLDRVVTALRLKAGELDVFAAADGQEIDLPRHGRRSRPSTAPNTALGRRVLAGARVLVANEEITEVQLVAGILAEEGLKVSTVQDGDGALAMARVLRPDMLVVDASLNTREGVPAAVALRASEATRNVPILLLVPRSGSGDEPAPDLSDVGFTDCFAKPFSSPMLRSRVRAWLARTAATIYQVDPTLAEGAVVVAEPIGAKPAGRRSAIGRIADRAEFLATIPIFETLAPVERWRVATRLAERVFPAATEIIVEGERGDALYIIRSGLVRVSGRSGGGSRPIEAQLSELGAGEVFGELALLDDLPRSASVIAIKRTRALVLGQTDFLSLVARAPDFALALLRVQAARLRQADQQLAREAPDALTGLAGRRTLENYYRRMAASARRRGTGMGVLMIDVDNLKLLNDLYGHLAGDEALRRVADILTRAARLSDLPGRWGGDEFVIVLPDASEDGALLVATRIRRMLQDLPRDAALPVPISTSIGTAWSAQPPDALDDLIAGADRSMYAEKRRRQIVPISAEMG